ncbi:GNAT family N-acetyltransferase [Paenibacillus frigoriresistens]|uniref:GNAT family N-acetyltransferase n=1 Tax=Paenibacillus alginolyticus TaxID=59839 RepID=UPI001562F496|nr:GNAT family N-acetyltransferase [Paenibacillus frigoriresistens]NRF90172.1 GNAT family N-acetyltransferase [Paenibacillus frigoriresistens]
MTIMRLESNDKSGVMSLFRSVTQDLKRKGIHQWDRFYPNGIVIGRDLRNKNLFGISMDAQIVAVVVLDTKQSAKYSALQWSDTQGKSACIHRLAVHPEYQGRGLGKQLLQFAENLAGQQGNSSIRLDVYTGNRGALSMYSRAGYHQVGEIKFPFREVPYMCFEKIL